MLELLQIINAMKGKNEEGKPKSGISIKESTIDAADNIKPVKEYMFTTPFVDLTVNGNFILFDLCFPTANDAELRTAWNYLKGFGEKQNEQLDEMKTTLVEFTVVPLEYNGKYFCSLLNPIFWALQPSAPGRQSDSIRMLFEKEAVNFFEGPEISEAEIEKEIEAEHQEHQRIEEIERRKEQEHEEYLDKLNKRFNRLDK